MKEYEKLLVEYETSLGILKDDAISYKRNKRFEDFYSIMNELPSLGKIRQALFDMLPENKKQEVLPHIAELEKEILQLLNDSDPRLASLFKESISLHHHLRETEVEISAKS